MTIAQQKAVAAGDSSSTALTSFTVTFDSAPAAGSVLYAACAADKGVGAWTTPGGWAVAVEYVNANVSQAVYYRVSDGTETGVTFAWSTAIRFAGGYLREEAGVTVTGMPSPAAANSASSNVTSIA
ncbi:MAG: hypothetical protein KBA95_15520, partial [Acidobacteria bacterium]|nr:hypothetical protein [Acidobacteriota bacterium]